MGFLNCFFLGGLRLNRCDSLSKSEKTPTVLQMNGLGLKNLSVLFLFVLLLCT